LHQPVRQILLTVLREEENIAHNWQESNEWGDCYYEDVSKPHRPLVFDLGPPIQKFLHRTDIFSLRSPSKHAISCKQVITEDGEHRNKNDKRMQEAYLQVTEVTIGIRFV
jgi:hypothetical protein